MAYNASQGRCRPAHSAAQRQRQGHSTVPCVCVMILCRWHTTPAKAAAARLTVLRRATGAQHKATLCVCARACVCSGTLYA
eukprot:733013-Pelagomonas_calceolata.AAC.1